MARFLIHATRTATNSSLSKAIEEDDDVGAIIEFCNWLGVQPAWDGETIMGSRGWVLWVTVITSKAHWSAAVARYNRRPINADFSTRW